MFYPINKIIVFLINLVGLWLIYLVNKRNPRKVTSYLFTLMTFLMFVWVNFAYLARIMPNNTYGLWTIKSAWAITPLFFITIYFFIDAILDNKKRKLWFDSLLIFVGVLNIPFVIFTPLVIKDIWFNAKGILEISYGGLEWIFFGEVLVLTVLNFYTLLKKRSKQSDKNRKRTDYLLIGFSFFFLMNAIFNISLPVFFNIFNLYVFGDYSTIVLISFIAYAIIKSELFGIKVLMTQALIIIIAILLLANVVVSDSWLEYTWNISLFVSFAFFGYYFIKSVRGRMEARKKIEKYTKRLKKANTRLRQLDKQKTEFMSFAAHQLRAPLTSVQGFASLILEGAFGKTSKKINGAAQTIYDASKSMSKSVDQYLNISRIEQGRMQYEMTEFDLYRLAKSVTEEFKPRAYKKGIKLKISSDKNKKYMVKADEGKLKEVLTNFVDNAVKYTKEGDVKVYVSKEKKGKIRVAISDSGIGMSQKTIKKLFQRYSRAEDTQGISGTGLGLFIAKKMVEAQKGRVWAESPGENQGSTFYIELPELKK